MSRVRLGLALAGLGLALFSVALDDRRLAWVAIALLITSLILRLALRKGENAKPDRNS